MINIITRTHNRETYFNALRASIESQTYKDINWIVGSDCACPYYPNAIKLYKDYQQPLFIPNGHYYAPYNKYLETLATYCKDGYIIYVDDDDCFVDENSLSTIIDNVEEDKMLVWKVIITPTFIVPNRSFGKTITPADFSGIGFCFHTKHLPVEWGIYSYGDYRVGKQLESKLKIKWLNKVLTRTQNGAHGGK